MAHRTPARERRSVLSGRMPGPARLLLFVGVITVAIIIESSATQALLGIRLLTLLGILTTIAACVYPTVWVAVAGLFVVSQIIPSASSFTLFFLTMIGGADLNSRPWPLRGLSMIVLGMIGMALSLMSQGPAETAAMALILIAPSFSAMLLRNRLRSAETRLELARARRLQEHFALAREMHDTVALSMSHVVLRTNQELLRADLDPHDAGVYRDIHDDAREALRELRRVLGILRSDTETAPLGPPPKVDGEWARAVELLRASGFAVDSARRLDDPSLDLSPESVRVAALAIRELAANVIRHGDPQQKVEMTLSRSGNHLNVLMSNAVLEQGDDEGVPPSGLGLTGLRERLEALGGTLTTIDDEGRWLTVARIPADERTP